MTADYGFALLNAINSGYFAAQSTINNEDYNLKIKTYLLPELTRSIIKRNLINKFSNEDFEKKIVNKIKNKIKVRNFITNTSRIYNLLNLIFAKILMFTKIRKYPL